MERSVLKQKENRAKPENQKDAYAIYNKWRLYCTDCSVLELKARDS